MKHITKKKTLFKLYFIYFTILTSQAISENVDEKKFLKKAIEVKGNVVLIDHNTSKNVQQNDFLPLQGSLKTGNASQIKVQLDNGSILTLGPNSHMELKELQNSIPTISLVSGSLRSKIQKNIFAAASTTEKIKFLIKTNTSIMGVRGTDFLTIHNDEKKMTSLVTFEGAVSIAKRPNSLTATAPQEKILETLNKKSQLVTQGCFSSVMESIPNPTIPTKISPLQFERLAKSDFLSAKKPSSSITPPGINPKTLSTEKISPTPQDTAIKSTTQAPPQGVMDHKRQEYAPPAGGALDIKSGEYIMPDATSTLDNATGTFGAPSKITMDATGNITKQETSGSTTAPHNDTLEAMITKPNSVALPAPPMSNSDLLFKPATPNPGISTNANTMTTNSTDAALNQTQNIQKAKQPSPPSTLPPPNPPQLPPNPVLTGPNNLYYRPDMQVKPWVMPPSGSNPLTTPIPHQILINPGRTPNY